MDIFKVKVTKKAFKGLEKCPVQAIRKFQLWVATVENLGLREARKSSGYHDEPLKGKRQNQRSIRLTKAYRAIYIEDSKGDIEFVEVIEVNKHEY